MPIIFSFDPDFNTWSRELWCFENKKDGKIFKESKTSETWCDMAFALLLTDRELKEIEEASLDFDISNSPSPCDLIHALKLRKIVVPWRKKGIVKLEDL